jgi:TctA family transporter
MPALVVTLVFALVLALVLALVGVDGCPGKARLT